MNNLNKIPIHDSSLRHSTGQAIYIDDMPEQENLLHGAPVLSKVACGKIKKISSQESDKYFLTRNRKSQIGARASKQSQKLKSKSNLKTKFDEIDKK